MMKLKGMKALRAEFAKAECIVQIRVITKMNSTIDLEGPVTEAEANAILKLGLGDGAPAIAARPLGQKVGRRVGR